MLSLFFIPSSARVAVDRLCLAAWLAGCSAQFILIIIKIVIIINIIIIVLLLASPSEHPHRDITEDNEMCPVLSSSQACHKLKIHPRPSALDVLRLCVRFITFL